MMAIAVRASSIALITAPQPIRPAAKANRASPAAANRASLLLVKDDSRQRAYRVPKEWSRSAHNRSIQSLARWFRGFARQLRNDRIPATKTIRSFGKCEQNERS